MLKFVGLALYRSRKGYIWYYTDIFKMKINHINVELELFKQKKEFSKLACKDVSEEERLPSIVKEFHHRLHRYLKQP